MTEIFVSYARADEAQAMSVAEALRTQGYHAWRDDELPPHRLYADVIEERLNAADAVVVLWSSEAKKSQWVRAEADSARNRGTLVQATLDGTVPPMPFNQTQCADLSGSQSPVETSGWFGLMGSIQTLAGPKPTETTDQRRPLVSVCVLPFVNMSGDSEQEYFSDGISEDITTDLSKVSALAVTARNTAFQFKAQSIDVRDIARRLGVSHVLEGSVRRAGPRVRITAQLIDGATGDHVWADRYDRDLTDIFAIQDEISQAIVDALKIKLLPRERKAIEQRGTNNPDAYNLYLLARKYWISGNWGDTRQLELVLRICRRAVELDSSYARAWGLMALVQCILHFTFGGEEVDGTEAASRALALDPTIAEAFCVRARHFYEQGAFGECDQALDRALELDPDSWEVNREAARIYYFQRRFADAARHYERAVALDDTDYHSWSMLCSNYEALGDSEGARRAAQMSVTHAERVITRDPTNGMPHSTAVYGLAFLGEQERARERIERALLISPDNMLMRYNFACILALKLNEPDRAIDLLEPVIRASSQSALKAFMADPDLDSLRDHPRLKRIIEFARAKLDSTSHPLAASEAQLRS